MSLTDLRRHAANCSVCPWLNPIFPLLPLPFIPEILSAINGWRPEISSVCSVPIVFIAYLQLATIRAITLSQDNFLPDLVRSYDLEAITQKERHVVESEMLYRKAYWRYNVLSLFFLIMNYRHASTSDTTQCFKMVVQTGIMTALPKSEAENSVYVCLSMNTPLAKTMICGKSHIMPALDFP